MDQDRRERGKSNNPLPPPPSPTPRASKIQARTAAGTQGPISFYFFCYLIFQGLVWRLQMGFLSTREMTTAGRGVFPVFHTSVLPVTPLLWGAL